MNKEPEYQLSEETKRHIEQKVLLCFGEMMDMVMLQLSGCAMAVQKVMFDRIRDQTGDEWKNDG